MKFYDLLQLDPLAIKTLMNDSSSHKEKIKLGISMSLRSILIVIFAVIFISTLSTIFGPENTPMTVAIFCILMSIRFVDFGYCIKDSMLTLSIVFLLLLISPTIACSRSPLLGFFINTISLFIILFITCDKPEMGNGGLYGFAYVYLCGNPVYGDALIQRFYLTLTCLMICGLIFYSKHKDKNTEIRFLKTIKSTDVLEFKYQWMIKMSVGISSILLLGMIFNIERFMWAGFACSSLLSLHSPSPKIKERFIERFIGVIAGAIIFLFIYHLIPIKAHSIIGPLGGFCLGFCANYKYKTALNCLGALLIASELYGLHFSILLRISNTIVGLVFAVIFLYLYDRLITSKFQEADNTF